MVHEKFIGKFPQVICRELEEKAKPMIEKIYQAGKIFTLRDVEKTPGVRVLDTWHGENIVVFQESLREIHLRQDGNPAGFIDCLLDNRVYACQEQQTNFAIQAAHLLCEYLFPGDVYTKQDLKEEKPQKILHFLQDLFPEEPIIDMILLGRLNDHAIRHAAAESNPEDADELYEKIALWPAGDVLMRIQERWRHSVEDPDNDKSILSPAGIHKLDEKHPANINSGTAAAFFLLCLRRELLKQFDFINDPSGETVRAAMLLNSMRNGGRAPSGTQPLELPEQVYLRLFIVEWEMLVQLLAFLAKLPADDVRSLTKRVVLQRGEDARKQFTLGMRNARLETVKQKCKAADYVGTLHERRWEELPYSTQEVVRSMRDSAEYEWSCPIKTCCRKSCMTLLRELCAQGIYFPRELYEELCPAGHYALLLAVKAIACKRDGTCDRRLAARFINQYLREGVLPPDVEEN